MRTGCQGWSFQGLEGRVPACLLSPYTQERPCSRGGAYRDAHFPPIELRSLALLSAHSQQEKNANLCLYDRKNKGNSLRVRGVGTPGAELVPKTQASLLSCTGCSLCHSLQAAGRVGLYPAKYLDQRILTGRGFSFWLLLVPCFLKSSI